MGYQNAIEVFEDLAAGRVPSTSGVIAGALSLEFIPGASRDVQDAFLALRSMSAGFAPDLDESGRARCAHFAEMLRVAS